MEGVGLWYFLIILGIFASACSQVLLKRSANRSHKSFVHSILNWRVIIAYAIFFCSLFINITAMSRGVNLKDMPILESLGYIFVPLLSFIILKEHIAKKTIYSLILIMVGIIFFYL